MELTENGACNVCGSGLGPDQRMNFDGSSLDDIILAAYMAISTAQEQLASAECCLAKLMQLRAKEGA